MVGPSDDAEDRRLRPLEVRAGQFHFEVANVPAAPASRVTEPPPRCRFHREGIPLATVDWTRAAPPSRAPPFQVRHAFRVVSGDLARGEGDKRIHRSEEHTSELQSPMYL